MKAFVDKERARKLQEAKGGGPEDVPELEKLQQILHRTVQASASAGTTQTQHAHTLLPTDSFVE